jgi:hypothetical protein
MKRFRLCLENNLSMEQTSFYINDKFHELNNNEMEYVLSEMNNISLNEIISNLTLSTTVPEDINATNILNTLNDILSEQEKNNLDYQILNNNEQVL